MDGQFIKCPYCGKDIELNEALTKPIRDAIRPQIEEEVLKKEKELESKAKSLSLKEKELEKQLTSLDEEVEKRLSAETDKLRKDALKKAQEQEAAKTEILEKELENARGKIREANAKELELLKQKRELEEGKEALELEVQRRIDDERKKIVEKALQRAEESQQLKMREKDNLITSLQEKLEDAQRKIQTGSQEWQGEALEEQMIEALRSQFIGDVFEDVPKGIKGADIVQKVCNSSGKICGVILWETKNTKSFSATWIDKLKKDLQACSADIGVIMSVALPKEIKNFGAMDEVWITDYPSAIGLCTALRHELIKVARERLVVQHQDTMKDVVYQYITGQDFARRVRSIVGSYTKMQQDLESEKRAMTKIWKKREKQISLVLDNITEMHGELEGIVGTRVALPDSGIPELEDLTEEEESS